MQVEKDQLYTLSQELLSTKASSPSYPVFLFEQFIWFKLKAVKEGRPYEMATSAQFLEIFMESNFIQQNLFCELWAYMKWLVLWTTIRTLPLTLDMFSSGIFPPLSTIMCSGKDLSRPTLTMRPTLIFGFEASLNILSFSSLCSGKGLHIPSRPNR